MCGICGEMRFNGTQIGNIRSNIMLDAISSRGPDNTGSYTDKNIFLGHNRLSVIDISSNSDQPMEDDDLIIVFNGVIFNYKKLRNTLSMKGYEFFSDGDTEVILKCYKYYGEDMLNHLDGVFSFVIYDRNSREFFCARDRLGIKPFYYTYTKDAFAFSSNTTAFIDNKEHFSINKKSLHHQFTLHSVVPAPDTILSNIFKLEPGSFARVQSDGKISKTKYYSFNHIKLNTKIIDKEIIEETDRLLLKAIEKRFYTADVDVGVLLSGGLDSSLIVAMASKNNLSDINTFSIGFPTIGNEEGNEFYYSDKISKQFKTNHHKYNISQDELFGSLDDVVKAMPEPMFSQDSAAFYLLAEKVSLKQKVVLSGQGADELFGGYFWYKKMDQTKGSNVEKFTKHYFDREHDDYCKMINKSFISSDYSLPLIERLYDDQRNDISFLDKTLRIDLSTLIIDDPVKRVDSMTMSHGLETRVPFLDRDLVEFVLSIPSLTKLKNDGKYYLKKIAEKYLDDELIYRDKFYFPVPPLKIIQGQFYTYIKSILLSSSCKRRGLYNSDYIEKLLSKPNSYFTKLNGNTLWHLGLLERWFQLNHD
jgi:asparagine synthase (glutamine-hydrolysing)